MSKKTDVTEIIANKEEVTLGKATIETTQNAAGTEYTLRTDVGIIPKIQEEPYPIHDRIVVKRVEAVSEVGGIVIPSQHKEQPVEGTVQWVGKGKVLDNGSRINLEVKPGDRVLFGKYAGHEVQIDGVGYTIMREADVLVILKRGA